MIKKGADLSLCFSDIGKIYLDQNLAKSTQNYDTFKLVSKKYFSSLFKLFLIFRFLNNKGKQK